MKGRAGLIAIIGFGLITCTGSDDVEAPKTTGDVETIETVEPLTRLAATLAAELPTTQTDAVVTFEQRLAKTVFLTVCQTRAALALEKDALTQSRTKIDLVMAELDASLERCEPEQGGVCHTVAAETWSSVLETEDRITELTEAFRLYEGGRSAKELETILNAIVPVLDIHLSDWLRAHMSPSPDAIRSEAKAISHMASLAASFTDTIQDLSYNGLRPASHAAESLRNIGHRAEALSEVMKSADLTWLDNGQYRDEVLVHARPLATELHNLKSLQTHLSDTLSVCTDENVWDLIQEVNEVRARNASLQSCVEHGVCEIEG